MTVQVDIRNVPCGGEAKTAKVIQSGDNPEEPAREVYIKPDEQVSFFLTDGRWLEVCEVDE